MNFLSENQLEILLVIFSFLLFYYFRLDFIREWDTFGYIQNIYYHSRSGLDLGRPGFIYFFIPIWELCSKFFKMPILEFYHVVLVADLIFSSLTIPLVYLITKRITRNKLIALASAIILIFSKDFIRFAGDTLIEPMMIFVIVLSYFLYVKSIDKKSLFYFYLSAFIFGYAFEVKEVALFSIFFFPALLLTRSESKYFSVKNHLFFILIFLVTALIMPVYFYAREGNRYIRDILLTSSWNKLNFSNWQQVYDIMKCGFGILLFPLIGFIVLLLRSKFYKLLVIFTLFIPNIIFSFYGHRESRYFVLGYISLSILTAYCFFYIVQYSKFVLRLPNKHLSVYFYIILMCLALYNSIYFYQPLIANKEYAKSLRIHGLMLLNSFPENTVFIVGVYSALMGQYYIPLTRSRKQLIWSGWNWPHKRLEKVVGRYLSHGKRIIIDLDGFQWRQDEKQDVARLIASYKTKEAGNNLIELYKCIPLKAISNQIP